MAPSVHIDDLKVFSPNDVLEWLVSSGIDTAALGGILSHSITGKLLLEDHFTQQTLEEIGVIRSIDRLKIENLIRDAKESKQNAMRREKPVAEMKFERTISPDMTQDESKGGSFRRSHEFRRRAMSSSSTLRSSFEDTPVVEPSPLNLRRGSSGDNAALRKLRPESSSHHLSRLRTSLSSSTSSIPSALGVETPRLQFLRLRNLFGSNLNPTVIFGIVDWEVAKLLDAMLNASPSVRNSTEQKRECMKMNQRFVSQLQAEGYYFIADMIPDIDEVDFKQDLMGYGLTKKKFLNELHGLLLELRSYRENTGRPRSNSSDSFESNGSADSSMVMLQSPHLEKGTLLDSISTDVTDYSIISVNSVSPRTLPKECPRTEPVRKLEEDALIYRESVPRRRRLARRSSFDSGENNINESNTGFRIIRASENRPSPSSNSNPPVLLKSRSNSMGGSARFPMYKNHAPSIVLNRATVAGLPKASNSKLAIDLDAVDMNKSYNYSELDGALQYGKLVIGVGGVKGAIGMQALGTSAREVIKGGDRIEMNTGLKYLKKLGKGAGGIVYQAIHVPSLCIVAVKDVAISDKSQRKQMARELDALLLGHKHPNIVTFYDSFFVPKTGTTSLIFECMGGGSLQDMIDSRVDISNEKLTHIAIDCLRGLHYLHSDCNLLHRDIKPSNLLVNVDGVVKIADFGISRDLDECEANTYLGTSFYMSPERIMAQEYSFKADVWSLGLCILTCALGKYPFEMGEKSFWNIRQILLEQSLPSMPSRFDERFTAMIKLSLERDPKIRVSCQSLLQCDYFKEDAISMDKYRLSPKFFKPDIKLDSEVKSQLLNLIVDNVIGYYRGLCNQNLDGPVCVNPLLSLTQVAKLAKQSGIPAHELTHALDRALKKLQLELQH